MTAMRRQKGHYFEREPGTPDPIRVETNRRVAFSEVDPMGILWHGRYASYFELANEKLGRRCGMSYEDFRREDLRAPMVQFHVDYFASPVLAETVTICAQLIWNEGARLNVEYKVVKENGTLAASGYTVQMFVTAEGEPLLTSPELLLNCREKWEQGEI
ncbi:MAG: acyl-CoA thioesterase [Planctomycetota bacterium]